MEKFGQILFAVQGSPEKVSNQKKQIFEKYYDLVFKGPKFDLSKSADYVKRYFEIKKEYESLGHTDISDQKLFFIMYIDPKFDAPLQEKIALFESSLAKYNPSDKNLADTRKLLYSAFKQQLDNDIDEYIQTTINK